MSLSSLRTFRVRSPPDGPKPLYAGEDAGSPFQRGGELVASCRPTAPPVPSIRAVSSCPLFNSDASTLTCHGLIRKNSGAYGLPPKSPRRPSMLSFSSANSQGEPAPDIKLLLVEMGTGYDQHGQDVTEAAIRAIKDALRSNSVPAFRNGALPGISSESMRLRVKLGVPRPLIPKLDVDRVIRVFPYGEVVSVDVVEGGLMCSSGCVIPEMGDTNDQCIIVNAAVEVGYVVQWPPTPPGS